MASGTHGGRRLRKNLVQVEAYVVVSDDDQLADHNGNLPDALKNDAEWEFFQAGLNRSDATILGRRTHEATPNHKHRNRIVMTRSHTNLMTVNQDNTLFWNPAESDLSSALNAFGPAINNLAIVGGQAVYDYFLTGPFKYTAFHLSRVRGVTLPHGTGLFGAIDNASDSDRPPVSAESVLESHDFTPSPVQELDAGVDVVTWIQTLKQPPVAGEDNLLSSTEDS